MSNYRISHYAFVLKKPTCTFPFKIELKTFERLVKVGEKSGENMHRCLLFPLNHFFPQKVFILPEFTKYGNKTAAEYNLYPQMELSSYIQSILYFLTASAFSTCRASTEEHHSHKLRLEKLLV